MNVKNSVASEIFKGFVFTDKEIELIENTFENVDAKKGTTLIKKDDIVKEQFYVRSGCLRSYFIDSSGKEHTVQFAISDWWISDYTAYFTSAKAIMTVECLQDSSVYKVSQEALETLYPQIPKIETFTRHKMEGRFSGFQKRILACMSQTAKERYLNFINTYPNIEQNVKNYHIASFLGITTESLSRIRKEIAG